MGAHVKVDETSCGPMCQHPYCWYSNRRVERGLPNKRNTASSEEKPVLSSEELPTLKVRNILADYGPDPGDQYPLPGATRMRSKEDAVYHTRSFSAPIARYTVDGTPQTMAAILQKTSPLTPHQSPVYSIEGPHPAAPSTRASPRSSNRSAPAGSVPLNLQEPQGGIAVNTLDMKGALDLGQVKRQGVIPGGNKVYVWVPSTGKDSDPPKAPPNHGETGSKINVHLKDMTQDMIPETMATKQSKHRKQKKKDTPTGGRPYTHPHRSPPPLTRRTLPQDFDDGIAQLLQLPREVLLEILEHTRESDLYDKNKVAMLLERLMPLIHFDPKDDPAALPLPLSPISRHLSSQASVLPAPPLHSSGILRQKKVTLLEGREKRAEPVRAPPPTRSMPFFLDESAMSGITSSSYTRHERPVRAGDDDRETTLPTPTVASEDFIKHKSTGLPRGTELSINGRRKVTSVSAKSLPPLQPGVRPTRPFNYATQSFDLALSPLSTLDYEESEKPSSPYSGRASTVYVTVPSLLSDHTPPVSPASCERTPIPPITRQSSAHFSNTSSAQSDDFNALHRNTPNAPPDVFRVPYGTDHMVRAVCSQGEDLTHVKPVGKRLHFDLPSETPLDTPSVAATTTLARAEGDIEGNARPIDTASTNTRDASALATPMKLPECTSPYDASTSVMAQASEKAAGSPMLPVTPLPSVSSPDVWPVVDERAYMQSPERKMERLANKQLEMILAPVAPPPSPEPTAMDVDYDIQDVSNKSSAASASLTPLAEEEEEDGEAGRGGATSPPAPEMKRMDTAESDLVRSGDVEGHKDNGEMDSRDQMESQEVILDQHSPGSHDREEIGTRSRGYHGDDEDTEGLAPERTRLDVAESDPPKLTRDIIQGESEPPHLQNPQENKQAEIDNEIATNKLDEVEQQHKDNGEEKI